MLGAQRRHKPQLHKHTERKQHITEGFTRGCAITQSKRMCVHALKGLALRRASHPGEIALAGSCRLHSTLAAAPVLFMQRKLLSRKVETEDLKIPQLNKRSFIVWAYHR